MTVTVHSHYTRMVD